MMEGGRRSRWADVKRGEVDLEDAVRRFEVHNRTEGKSARTVQWYNEVLSMLHGWLEAQGCQPS